MAACGLEAALILRAPAAWPASMLLLASEMSGRSAGNAWPRVLSSTRGRTRSTRTGAEYACSRPPPTAPPSRLHMVEQCEGMMVRRTELLETCQGSQQRCTGLRH